MAEYIEREDAINFVKKYTPTIDGETTMQCVETALKHAPASDVVEVVRCKDCQYLMDKNGSCWCEEHSDGFGSHIVYVDKDDFCSFGIKPED